jgi:CHASE3 domain sensor protein
MTKGQYTYVVVCLVISAVCCVVAAVMSYINNQRLAQHMRELAEQTK